MFLASDVQLHINPVEDPPLIFFGENAGTANKVYIEVFRKVAILCDLYGWPPAAQAGLARNKQLICCEAVELASPASSY